MEQRADQATEGPLLRASWWRHQPWGLIAALTAVLLVRPALSIAEVYDHLGGGAGRVTVTVVAYGIWVAAMVVRRDVDPVRTLALAGACYGVAVIVVNPFVWLFKGAPDIPPPGYVFGPVAVIALNALFGAAAGVVAGGLRRLRGR